MNEQFDTSGVVCIRPGDTDTAGEYVWSDLSPGVQGCIRAVFDAVMPLIDDGARVEMCLWEQKSFSDLHPDTLARIIADWERLRDRLHSDDTAGSGRAVWLMRQRGDFVGGLFVFPPVTPYLNDDGKVCLRPSPSVVGG